MTTTPTIIEEFEIDGYPFRLSIGPRYNGGPMSVQLRTRNEAKDRWDSFMGWDEPLSNLTDHATQIATATKSLKAKARKAVAQWIESDQIYPTLLQLLNETGGIVGSPSTFDDTAKVGDTAVIYSRGKYRPVLVTHVTKTGTITGAYITQGGLDEARRYQGPNAKAGITRKTAKAGTYFVWSAA